MLEVGALLGFLTDHRSAAGSIGIGIKLYQHTVSFNLNLIAKRVFFCAFPGRGTSEQIPIRRYEIMIGLR